MSTQRRTLKSAATHLKLASEAGCHNFGFSRTSLFGGELRFEAVDLRAVEKLVTDGRLGLRRDHGSRSASLAEVSKPSVTARTVRSSAMCACNAASCLCRAASLPEKSTCAGGAGRFSGAEVLVWRGRGASLSTGFGTRGPALPSAPFMAGFAAQTSKPGLVLWECARKAWPSKECRQLRSRSGRQKEDAVVRRSDGTHDQHAARAVFARVGTSDNKRASLSTLPNTGERQGA